MKRKSDSEMLPEYDFSRGTRGKFAARFRSETNVVVIDDDLAHLFPTSESVNAALRRQAKLERGAGAM